MNTKKSSEVDRRRQRRTLNKRKVVARNVSRSYCDFRVESSKNIAPNFCVFEREIFIFVPSCLWGFMTSPKFCCSCKLDSNESTTKWQQQSVLNRLESIKLKLLFFLIIFFLPKPRGKQRLSYNKIVFHTLKQTAKSISI